MKAIKKHAFLIFGYIVFCWALVSTIVDFIARTQFQFPFNMGIILGNGAIMLLGLVTISTAGKLTKLEERLERCERALASH